MNYSKTLPLIAAVAATIASTAALHAAEPSYDELRQQVGRLQSRLDEIEARQQSITSQAEVDRTVEQVLSDAAKRSQLLAADQRLTAGYDKGFFLGSTDGDFLLKPGLGVQFRYVANFNDDEEDDSEIEDGFEVRRLRPRIDGHVFSPKLTYSFQWDVARSGGNVTLLDAWAQYKFNDDWALRVGQFKESVFHEKDVSFSRQLAVDRSILDTISGSATDRVQGVALLYGGGKNNNLRAEAAFHDGANSKNTDFRDAGSNFGAGGRVEYKLAGDWADYRDFTAKGTKSDLLVIGGGADFTQSGDQDVIRSVVDAPWELPNGLGVFGALHGNFTSAADDDTTDFGGQIQVGYLLNPSWEVFGRYAVIVFDDTDADEDTVHEIAAGVNYYLGNEGAWKHNAKVTADVVYLPNGFPSNQTGLGVLAGDEDQFVLRGQLTFGL